MDHREEALRPEELELLSESAQGPLRRSLITATVTIGAVLVIAMWVLELNKGEPDPFELYGLPCIALFLAGFGFLYRTRLAPWLEIALLAGGSLALLERFAYTLSQTGSPILERVVNAYEVMAWFPAIYLFSFVMLPKVRAVLLCAALLGTSGLLLLTSHDSELFAQRLDLLEVYVANVASIGFVFLLSALKEHLVRTHSVANTLRQFAQTDYLTGIANRRHVSAELGRLVVEAHRDGKALCLILFDVDRFKRINDEFGHEAGDRVLQRVARVAEASLRGGDLLGRWGGEEFLIVLPGAPLEAALQIAERVRGVLDAQHSVGSPLATASFGVARLEPLEDALTLVRRTDHALLQAKEDGRNRVVAAR